MFGQHRFQGDDVDFEVLHAPAGSAVQIHDLRLQRGEPGPAVKRLGRQDSMEHRPARLGADSHREVHVQGTGLDQHVEPVRERLDVHATPAEAVHQVFSQRSHVRFACANIDEEAVPFAREGAHQHDVLGVAAVGYRVELWWRIS